MRDGLVELLEFDACIEALMQREKQKIQIYNITTKETTFTCFTLQMVM